MKSIREVSMGRIRDLARPPPFLLPNIQSRSKSSCCAIGLPWVLVVEQNICH